MQITPCGSSPSRRAPDKWFTGTVWQDPIVDAEAPARIRALVVSFEPGARTAWHTHPLGQTLYVLSGCGKVQSWGGPLQTVAQGDVVSFAPGEKHWHGGGPTTAMTHIAIGETLDGKSADWMERVTDEQFLA